MESRRSSISTDYDTLDTLKVKEVLKSLLSSSSSRVSTAKSTPRVIPVAPPPLDRVSVETQTTGVSMEGLLRAAGMTLANFSEDLRSLERRVERNNLEILNELKLIRDKIDK